MTAIFWAVEVGLCLAGGIVGSLLGLYFHTRRRKPLQLCVIHAKHDLYYVSEDYNALVDAVYRYCCQNWTAMAVPGIPAFPSEAEEYREETIDRYFKEVTLESYEIVDVGCCYGRSQRVARLRLRNVHPEADVKTNNPRSKAMYGREDELTTIRDAARWPLRPILPMKNTNRKFMDDNHLGFIVCREKTLPNGPVTVYIGLIFQIGFLGLDKLPTETFPSVEAMVDAGWIGD